MKKNRIYILPALVALCLTACDEVSEGDRYELLDEVETKRIVLLEEFTGQKCTNCPAAHRIIEGLKEQYGDNLISVSIHAGDFGYSEEQYPGYGLMQSEGDVYASHWNIAAYPSGVIDRTSGVLNSPEWAGCIRREIVKEASLEILASAELVTDEEGNAEVKVFTNLLSSAPVSGKLQLWITESHIVAVQLDGDNWLMDYEHNHVFRAAVNGTWGEDIQLETNVYKNVEHTIPVRATWNVENLSVVAFIYNEASGVLQAAECPVSCMIFTNNK